MSGPLTEKDLTEFIAKHERGERLRLTESIRLLSAYDAERAARKRAERERNDARAAFLACAQAIGVVYQAEGHAEQPGPVEEVVRAIARMTGERDEARRWARDVQAAMESKLAEAQAVQRQAEIERGNFEVECIRLAQRIAMDFSDREAMRLRAEKAEASLAAIRDGAEPLADKLERAADALDGDGYPNFAAACLEAARRLRT